jgi:hypothetical protein
MSSEAARTYFSLNPGVFTSDESWSYRDLQQLCISLGIHAGGKRQALEQRLAKAHREGRQGRMHGAGLFHDEEVNLASPSRKVSPRLLSPLVRTPSSPNERNGSARNVLKPNSILRRESSYGENGTPLSIKKSPSSLRFSPFNKVHVIPPKEETENFGQYREPALDAIGSAVWDDDDSDENDEITGGDADESDGEDDSSSSEATSESEEVWMNDGL